MKRRYSFLSGLFFVLFLCGCATTDVQQKQASISDGKVTEAIERVEKTEETEKTVDTEPTAEPTAEPTPTPETVHTLPLHIN